MALLKRQQKLVDWGYRGVWPDSVSMEESMLAELVTADQALNSGLQSYLRHMMAVMAFDAGRRGRLIMQPEPAHYTRLLATAVTEALHYFIGRDCAAPHTEVRYLAATLATLGITGLEPHLKFETNYTPLSWRKRYNLVKG